MTSGDQGPGGVCRTGCVHCEEVDPVEIQGLFQCNNLSSDHFQHVFTYEHRCCEEVWKGD